MYCAYSTLKINITFSYYCVFFNEFGPWCVIFLVWFVSSLFCHLAFYLPFSLSVSLSLFILRYYSHQGRTSLLSEWQSTGTGCLEVLWSLVLWRYSWPAWMPTYVTCYKEPALASWIQWSLEVPSNRYSSVILWCQYFQMETELLAKPAGELWNKWNTVAVVWYLLGSETAYHSHLKRPFFTVTRPNPCLTQLHCTNCSWTALLSCLVNQGTLSRCAIVLGVEISMPFNTAQL